MRHWDVRDLLGGGVVCLVGAFTAGYAVSNLALGSLNRAGPGLFPFSVGLVLMILGVSIVVPALFREGSSVVLEWRPALGVLVGVGAFALLIRPFGLIPAIIALLIVSSLAERPFRPKSVFGMAVILPASAYVIFRLGLGLPLDMIRFPY